MSPNETLQRVTMQVC